MNNINSVYDSNMEFNSNGMKNPIPTYRSGWDHVYQAPFQSNNPITQESSKTISNVYPNENNYETQYQQIDNSNYQQNQAIPIETRNVDKNNTFNQSSYSYNYKTIQQFQEIQSSLQLLFNEIDLLQIAGEITEVEASDLKQLAYQGDNRVKEALRLHSQGNSQLLIFLLHRQDNHLEMLNHRDMTYATYLQNQNSEEDQITSTISITSQQYQIPISSSIQQSNQQFIQNDSIIPMSQSLPHLFYYNNELCGLIMKRTQTKILFKKWKHCIFVVKPTSLLLFQSIDDWRLNRAIYWYCELTPGMIISPVFSKKKDETIYYCIEVYMNGNMRGKPLVLLASSYSTVVATLKTQIESNIGRIQ